MDFFFIIIHQYDVPQASQTIPRNPPIVQISLKFLVKGKGFTLVENGFIFFCRTEDQVIPNSSKRKQH